VASALKRDLGVDVERVEGHYGEFTVLVDGEQVVSGGALGFVGVLPSTRKVRESVEPKWRIPNQRMVCPESHRLLAGASPVVVTVRRSPGRRRACFAGRAFG